jgi:hypothetical protein
MTGGQLPAPGSWPTARPTGRLMSESALASVDQTFAPANVLSPGGFR